MSSFLVLTAIGPDRPGLVDEISEFLTKHNVNIEDSRMAVLGGEFAMILLGSGSEEIDKLIEKDLSGIESKTGLNLQIKPTIAPDKREVKPAIPQKLTATSIDHEGIVHEITHILHKHLINIESMDTHISHAPISGTHIFNMKCLINIPAGEKLSAIKRELEELAEKMNIDVELEPAESF